EFPVLCSLELQRLSDVDAANSVIAASRCYELEFGSLIFAKDRSDTFWPAAYLDHWNSTITAPAEWPRPEEPPMPVFPLQCSLLAFNSNVAFVNYDAPQPWTVDVNYPVQPGYGQGYQRVEVTQSKKAPGTFLVRFLGANRCLGIDRVKALDLAKLPEALF